MTTDIAETYVGDGLERPTRADLRRPIWWRLYVEVAEVAMNWHAANHDRWKFRGYMAFDPLPTDGFASFTMISHPDYPDPDYPDEGGGA